MKMVASTMLTDAFYDYWSDGEKVEFLEALDGAIAEIEELGFETYAKRTLAKLKEMREYCKDEIKEDVTHILFDATGHTPIVIPVINKV